MVGRRISFLRAIPELFGTAFLRYKFPLNAWAVALVGINITSVAFLNSLEGRVVFISALFAASTMTLIYQRLGFVRILGVAHIYWIPMLIWLIPHISGLGGALKSWAALLVLINFVSIVMDVRDAIRYVRGEREPILTW